MPLPTQSLTFDNMVVSTLQKRSSKLAVQALMEHRVLAELTKNKESTGFGGPNDIVVPLEYGENSTVGYLDSIESEVTVTSQEHLTAARYTPSLLAGVTKWNEEEKTQNQSKEQFINLMEVKERRLKATFRRILAQNLYGDGTGRRTNGLAMYVPSSVGSNTVGGIAEASYSFWKSQVRASCGSFAANGIFGTANDYVLNAFINCTDETQPGLIVSDNLVFEYAHGKFGQAVQYFNNEQFGAVGKMELRYQGTRWVWDKDCDSATMFILHPEAFAWYTTPGMDFSMTPVMTPPKQPWVRFTATIIKHQLTCNQRMLLARLSGWTR